MLSGGGFPRALPARETGVETSCVSFLGYTNQELALENVVSLARKPRNLALAAIIDASLADDLSYSQAVGRFLADSGIQGLLFKSLVGPGANLLVFLENCAPGQLKVRKLDETMDTLKQILSKRKR